MEKLQLGRKKKIGCRTQERLYNCRGKFKLQIVTKTETTPIILTIFIFYPTNILVMPSFPSCAAKQTGIVLHLAKSWADSFITNKSYQVLLDHVILILRNLQMLFMLQFIIHSWENITCSRKYIKIICKSSVCYLLLCYSFSYLWEIRLSHHLKRSRVNCLEYMNTLWYL